MQSNFREWKVVKENRFSYLLATFFSCLGNLQEEAHVRSFHRFWQTDQRAEMLNFIIWQIVRGWFWVNIAPGRLPCSRAGLLRTRWQLWRRDRGTLSTSLKAQLYFYPGGTMFSNVKKGTFEDYFLRHKTLLKWCEWVSQWVSNC